MQNSSFLALLFAPLLSFVAAAQTRFDLVVYGGTAGGVVTAVAAAREGASVALLEPGNHLGGMVSGGLGWTDFGVKEVIGGYSREFFERVGKHYGEPLTWHFEPHVAEQVFREMAREAGVKVFFEHRLKEQHGVRKSGLRVVSVTMENGAVFEAKIFADCSYEGDLLAQVGVSYTWGREGVKDYGESLAGVRPRDRGHQFDIFVSARDAQKKLLPEISPEPRGELGSADKRVQAYNFRMCLSSDKKNQVPFFKPEGYNPKRYQLLSGLIEALTRKQGKPPVMKGLMIVSPLPNHKTDINNYGAFSTDYIGKNYDYPNAGYKRRAGIWQDHINYIAGFFYFLTHDPSVPKSLQNEMNGWGLAKDEFTDTGNWPHQLYVREARRMVGDFVMTQKDIQKELTKPDDIGMGSYNSDSHNVQRYVQEDGGAQNEGNMEVAVTPYQIPYRIMLPKKTESSNLLVPVCFSASHVTYSTVRMEPQYMILGQAAGVAAKMAIASNKPVQEIDTKALTAKLRAQRAVLEYSKK
jgi:hypothetical protein